MPHPVDIKVGKKLREIRTSRGMSQGTLAQELGITCQQFRSMKAVKIEYRPPVWLR